MQDVRQQLSDEVYQHLLDAVLRREIAPGDLLDRREIAARLGVSVSPVVHALGRLQSDGLVEILPRKVTRLRSVRPEDFRAHLLVRNALECQAARIYRGRPVRSRSASLKKLARAVDSTRDGTRINWPAEIAFHRALVELVGSRGFMAEFDRVMRLGLFVLVSTFSEHSPFPPDPTRKWHANLVERLKTDDPDAAERIMREHLESGRERYLLLPS